MIKRKTANTKPQRLVFNSFLSLMGKGGSLVSNTVILLLVAYWRGAAEAGVFSLAAKYATLSLGFALLGLDNLLIRDVAQNPRQARNYVINLGLLRLLVGATVYILVTLFVALVPDYAPRTTWIVILFVSSLIPEGLYRLFQSTLIALDAYHLLAYVGIIRAALGLPLVVGALWLQTSLKVVVLLHLGIYWLAMLTALLLVRRQLRSAFSVAGADKVERLSPQRAARWSRSALSFAVIDGLYTLEWQLDVVLLSFFTSEEQIGLYGVAQSILSLLMVLLYSTDTVVYPLLSRIVVQGQRSTEKAYRRLVGAIAITTIPFAVLLVFSTRLIIPPLLGDEFVPIYKPLYWLIAAWVIHFLNVPSARTLISLGRQRYVATLVTLSVGLNVLFSLSLIPSQGIVAPAIARTISATIYALLCTIIVLWLLSKSETWNTSRHPGAEAGQRPGN